MEMMMRTFGKLDGRNTDDLSLMGDEDLERLLNSKLRRANNGDAPAGIAPDPGAAEVQGKEKSQEETTATGTNIAANPDDRVGDSAPAVA